LAFCVAVACPLLLVDVPPLLRAAAVAAGTTNALTSISAEMVAASRDLVVTLSAPVREMSGSGGLKSVSSPAIRVCRTPVVKRIVIDVSVISVEAVEAGVGAAVAPVVAVPAGAGMAFAIDRAEIRRRRRSAGAAEDGSGHCSRNKKTFHVTTA
jgi:hypothetical protein